MIHIIGCILIALVCFPAVVSASSEEPQGGITDVYVGVIKIAANNVKFLVVDESDVPIDGASIDIWVNETLKYQLLGVTYDHGIYETFMPYGAYPYQVYKSGYKTTVQELVLSKEESFHIEKVVLKKEQQKDPNGNQSGESTEGIKRPVKTGDSTRVLYYIMLAGISMILVLILYWKRKPVKEKR